MRDELTPNTVIHAVENRVREWIPEVTLARPAHQCAF